MISRSVISLLNSYIPADNSTLGMSSDNAKRRENLGPHRLEWQGELDSHLADLDSRLKHPRRRAGDGDRQPALPELGHGEMTTELLDEIAWRVAEQIRRNPEPVPSADAREASGGGPKSEDTIDSGLRPGKLLMIRYQMPRLPWPFRLFQRRRRRRQHPLTTARVRV